MGVAGRLLDELLAEQGLDRRAVYIANVVKCRPPDNRTPEADEMEICGQFLHRQLQVIRPKANRLAKFRYGITGIANGLKSNAKVIVRHRVIRLQSGGLS